LRLTRLGYELGLAGKARMDRVIEKEEKISKIISLLKKESIDPDGINGLLNACDTQPVSQKVKLAGILLRPQISLTDMINHVPFLKIYVESLGADMMEEIEEAEILLKYEGYLEKEQELAQKLSRHENMPLDEDFNYHQLGSISYEARDKLSKIKPRSIGQASRISGVSPADISVLLVYIGR
jgi:tRNA uridine 5-carboxymethylaminomethyl modification enzyme